MRSSGGGYLVWMASRCLAGDFSLSCKIHVQQCTAYQVAPWRDQQLVTLLEKHCGNRLMAFIRAKLSLCCEVCFSSHPYPFILDPQGNLSGNVAARVPFSTELQSHLAVRLSSKRRVR